MILPITHQPTKYFGWGSAPEPLGEIKAVARTTTWKGAGLLLRDARQGREKEGRDRGGEGKGRERKK